MIVELEDLLSTGLVVLGVQLLNKSDSKQEFVSRVDGEVSETPVVEVARMVTSINVSDAEAPSLPSPTPILRLDRDRISLDFSPGRSSILQEYAKPGDFARLVEVTNLAFELTDFHAETPSAYGVNIIAVYSLFDGVTASQFIADQMYDLTPLREYGYHIRSASSDLSLERDGLAYNVRFQPRLQSSQTPKLYVGLNAHSDDGSSLLQADLNALFESAWHHLDSVVRLFSRR